MHKENMTYEQMLNDFDYQNIVGRTITKIYNKRKSRPKPKAGFRYKKDGFDKLISSGHLTREYFIKNIMDIWRKESNLPMQERLIIQHVCNNAIIEYVTPKE